MVMMTVTPAEASPDRMSTTLAALLLSSPAHQEQHEVEDIWAGLVDGDDDRHSS